MKRPISFGLAVMAAAFSLTSLTPAHAGKLSKIGGALAYPFKKAGRNGANNVKKTGGAIAYPIKKGAGNGSKAFNTGGKAVQYPVRKVGVNTSKTTHKATQ